MSSRSSPMSGDGNTNLVMSAKKKISYWYTQYELILCINIFEPWERKLLNALVLGTAVMVSYSSYVYLPNYMRSLLGKTMSFLGKGFEQD